MAAQLKTFVGLNANSERGVCVHGVGSARCADDLGRVQRPSGRLPERTSAHVSSAPGTARRHRSAMPLPSLAFGLNCHNNANRLFHSSASPAAADALAKSGPFSVMTGLWVVGLAFAVLRAHSVLVAQQASAGLESDAYGRRGWVSAGAAGLSSPFSYPPWWQCRPVCCRGK